MRLRPIGIAIETTVVLTVGVAGIASVRASAGGDDRLPVEYSYDTGSHTARVFAYCIGTTEVNLLGDTDEMRTWPDSSNCAEGGFLRDPANDVELEDD